MMNFAYVLSGVGVVSCILTFMIQRHHFLMCLLSLEGTILCLSLMLFLSLGESELFLLLVLFTFAACEASLGLACLVMMLRSCGTDLFKMLSVLKC